MGQPLKRPFHNNLEKCTVVKTKIMKNDRAALMYFIAAEIYIRTNSGLDRSREIATDSLHAASAGLNFYNQLITSNPNAQERAWLQREEVNYVLLDRLSESLAQLIYLNVSQTVEYKKKLEETLRTLPCSYINNNKLTEEKVYERIIKPERFDDCRRQRV